MSVALSDSSDDELLWQLSSPTPARVEAQDSCRSQCVVSCTISSIKQESSTLVIDVDHLSPSSRSRVLGFNMKHKTHASSPADVIEIHESKSDIDSGDTSFKHYKKRVKYNPVNSRTRLNGTHIPITRQRKVDELITLMSIPHCWSVSHPEHTVTYLLNLTDDSHEWWNENGELLSMAAIIKSQMKS